jgi:hypothetical protein
MEHWGAKRVERLFYCIRFSAIITFPPCMRGSTICAATSRLDPVGEEVDSLKPVLTNPIFI